MDQKYQFNWAIKGHSKQLGLLQRVVESDRLAHAYIFSGPAQVGKKTIARKLAQHLLCQTGSACGACNSCTTQLVGSNPDYIELISDESLKVEAMRELSYKLSLKPYSGIYKVAIIDNAHLMTTEASNSLLKVLEEPKENTLIILVTNQSYSLLPTITSRAQKIHFGSLPDYNFTNPEEKEKITLRSNWLEKFLSQSLGNKMVLAAELSDQENTDLIQTLHHWLLCLQNNLRDNPTQELVNKISAITKTIRLINKNVNIKLALSNLMAST